MTIVPGMLIPAPEPLPRRYGLFDGAIGPLDLPGHGEGGGVRYVPVTCGEAHSYGINCYQGAVLAPDKPLDGEPDEVSSGVFAVLSTLNCGVVGYTDDEASVKVQRALESSEQSEVERTFWTGEDFANNSISVLNLENTAEAIFPPGIGNRRIEVVIATLEEYAYRTHGYGYRAYIHAPSRFAPYAADANLIVQDGNRKVTPNGSVWVFGGGYPGTGAAGSTGWPSGGFLHITGQTTVWRSPGIQTYQAFDRVSNQRLTVAERAYSVTYDCFNARAEFNPLGLS